MKLSQLFSQLKDSEEFKKYLEKNPDAYFCAGFFIIDFQTGANTYQLDYCIPENKIETFAIEPDLGKIRGKPGQTMENKIPEKVSEQVQVEIENIQEIAKSEAEKHDMGLDKIIAILQLSQGKQIWNLTCMSGLNIIKIQIDAQTSEILKSEKSSMFDFIKIKKNKKE
jgi:hypothetical protein